MQRYSKKFIKKQIGKVKSAPAYLLSMFEIFKILTINMIKIVVSIFCLSSTTILLVDGATALSCNGLRRHRVRARFLRMPPHSVCSCQH